MSTFTVYTSDEFEELAHEHQERWLWDGILPACGTALLVGPAFVGKTSLVAMLAAAMLNTGSLAGRTVVGHGKMILTAAEHRAADLWETVVAAARGAGAEKPTNVLFLRDFDLDDDEQVEKLARGADRVNASVIVIDPIRRVTQLDENNSSDVSAMHRQLQKLGTDRRLVVVVHHFGRNRDVRGSTDFEAGADTVVRLSGGKDRVLIHAIHHAAPEVQVALTIRRGAEGMVAAEATDDRLDEIAEAVLQLLPQQDSGKTGLGMRRIREAMRERKVPFRNDQLDAALQALSQRGLTKNEGSAGKHAWVATVPAVRPDSLNSTAVGAEAEAGVSGPCHP
ncbi:MAG: AAA family ATPase [Labilithrix sp.]|nr:AAA family ATPase [Labilithrix sp.]